MRTGQSNYGYANASLDQLVELRRELRRPGISVQWGAIADVGFVAEVMRVRASLSVEADGALHICLLAASVGGEPAADAHTIWSSTALF